jgi:protein kinase-like protein/WD40 repeat protein
MSERPKTPSSPALDETLPSDVESPSPLSPSASTRLPPGARLGGRYLIRRFLGEGGMGAVYLADDEALGTEVALKLVHYQSRDESHGLAVLRDEVRLAQRVTHRNVCRTFDLEEVDGRWLVKMEYVRGRTLSERLAAESRLSVAEALTIARGVAAGLGAAHATGVVHRDLKPQNVLLEEGSGRVVLTDFGLARGDSTDLALPAGTPAYMAPEQTQPGPVDGRADQYALGCVLYRMLVGETPFPGEKRAQVIERLLTEAPRDPRRARPDLPPWLAQLILRLLAKQPAQRFADIAAVTRALEGPRSRRLAVAAGLALVAAAVAGAVIVRLHNNEWRALVVAQEPAYEENSDAVAISPDGLRMAYPSDRDGAWRIWVGPLAGGPSTPMTRPAPARLMLPRWTRDGQALLYRSRADGVYRIERIMLSDGRVEVMRIGASDSDDCGDALVFAVIGAPDCLDCGRVVAVGSDGERELFRTPPGRRVRWPRCDAPGRRVVFAVLLASETHQDRAAFWMVPVAGGPPRLLVDDREQNEYVSFHPDGRSILYSSVRDGASNIWELPLVGRARPRQVTDGGVDCAPALTPDGKTLVYNADTTSMPVFAYDEKGARRQLSHTLADFEGPVAAPDGRWLFAVARRFGRSEVRALSLVEPVERVVAEGDHPALSRDGRVLYFAVPDGGATRILAVEWEAGGAARALARVPGTVERLAMGGDGALHATSAAVDGAAAWRVPLDAPPLREAPAPYTLVLPAPTGGWRLAQRQSGPFPSVELWPPGARLDPDARPAPLRPRLRGATWDPDGRSILGWNGTAVERVFVDGRHQTLRETIDFAELAVAPDGKTWYGCEILGHVRRMLVTNFADRPRP